jgi:predicted MFS family arabinose efflux permease
MDDPLNAAKAAAPHAASVWSPLRHDVFRALWVAGLVSNFGALMHEVGEGWLMTSISASPRDVAMLQVADGVAMLLLAVPAGTIADIVDRRRLAVGTQLWLFAFTSTMALATRAGIMSPHLLIGLAFAMGLGAAVDEPLWQSLTSEAVPKGLLPAAITLGGVSMNIARACGPALGGVVVAAAGPAATFAVNAATFLWVAVVVARSPRTPRPTALPAEHWVSGIFAGFRYVRHTPALVSAFVRSACVVAPACCLSALLPVYARSELHTSSAGLGVLLAGMGIGALAGAWALPGLRAKLTPDAVVTVAAGVFAASLVGLYGAHGLVAAAGAMVVCGAGWMGMLSSLNIAVQIGAAPWVRTRILAVYLVVFQGAIALGSLVWGNLATRVGVRGALLVSAVSLLWLLLARLRFPLEAKEIDFTPTLHWPTPKLLCSPRNEDGPILVTIEYRVPLDHAHRFARALRALERFRRRDGAVEWAFYRDPEDPARWLETYVSDDWGAHLREHARVTADERHAEEHARTLLEPGTRPLVKHYVSGDITLGGESRSR